MARTNCCIYYDEGISRDLPQRIIELIYAHCFKSIVWYSLLFLLGILLVSHISPIPTHFLQTRLVDHVLHPLEQSASRKNFSGMLMLHRLRHHNPLQ